MWSVKPSMVRRCRCYSLRYDSFSTVLFSICGFHYFILGESDSLWKQHNAAEKVNMVHFSSENQLSLIPYWKGRSKLERYFANYSKWNILFAIYFVEGAGPDSQSPTFRDRFTGRQTDSDTWIYKFIISSFLQLKHFTKRGTSSLSVCFVFILNSKTFWLQRRSPTRPLSLKLKCLVEKAM